MTAPTTRETADHAELARLAEAAKSRLASGEWRADPNSPSFIWGDSLKGGDTHVAMVRGWGYLTGGGHGAIGLSEEDGLEAQFQVQRFIAAANPSTVLALLSEIAALRSNEKAALKECSEWARKAGEAIGKLETSEAVGIVEGWQERATEAERKLAEADRKIEDLTSALRSLAEGNLGDMSWQANYETIKQVARNAISKEAERG
jgi:hypothetical protein